MTTLPAVAVLMATFNGGPWIESQARSILEQDAVATRIIISDDGSTDNTLAILDTLADKYPGRVTLLPRAEPTGRASQNFFRLVREADLDPKEYVAFADQDDVWLPGKLHYQLAQLEQHHADGISSSVMAFNGSGQTRLIKKDWPEARFDYLFQSPGPGSTHVLTARAFNLFKGIARQNDLSSVEYHDWLDYAVLRARGCKWLVASQPLVRYRQHDRNTMGANLGVRARLERLRTLQSGEYRQQVLELCRLVRNLPTAQSVRDEIDQITELIENQTWYNRFELARRAGEFRRAPRDKMILRALILLGVW